MPTLPPICAVRGVHKGKPFFFALMTCRQLLKLTQLALLEARYRSHNLYLPSFLQLLRAWRSFTSLATSFPFSMTQLKHQISSLFFVWKFTFFQTLVARIELGSRWFHLAVIMSMSQKCCYLNGNG